LLFCQAQMQTWCLAICACFPGHHLQPRLVERLKQQTGLYCVNQNVTRITIFNGSESGFQAAAGAPSAEGRCSDGLRWLVQRLLQPLGGVFCKPAPPAFTPPFHFQSKDQHQPRLLQLFFSNIYLLLLYPGR